jgi:hypothetical protein
LIGNYIRVGTRRGKIVYLVIKFDTMPTKVSERNLILSIALFTIAIILLVNAKLFNAPVEISEKGIAFIVIGITAAAFALRYFKKAVVKL